MNYEKQKWGGYETPALILLDVAAEGMLCTSLGTKLETYDILEEQQW